MPTILQIDFPRSGARGDEMAAAFGDLTALIAGTAGLRWRTWTENEAAGESGGIYLLDDEASTRAYLEEHTRRLEGFGISDSRARAFDVNGPLTETTRGPLE